jgi:hypothetical protein
MPASCSTRKESSLLVGSMIRARTRCPEDLIAAGGVVEPEGVVGGAQSLAQVPHPRGRDRQRPTRLGRGVQAQVQSPCADSNHPNGKPEGQ